ncbi:pentatricopeptide repeat-containing protein, mitochondrial-like protein [Cinnamomum micranthum f. kanehirae]|uniref:Pentatricopeptide repeat-containing protein, mitochondrial-like protein n=1 Tax=Cinnamomum micranthum f. kanehirae TaxID=337451 RepID=A0A443Q2B5_9MAGN|nr:pentatricopeptide repeat-containing protein, mitochondrial-like protein [Cinnamomum micranthum f. kanehirae]
MLSCAYASSIPPTSPLFHKPPCIAPYNSITTLKPILHAPTKRTLSHFHFLLQLYSRAGRMREARHLFDKMPERTLVSWTILMSGYARHGPASETMRLFQDMVCQHSGARSFRPDPFIFSVVLRVCASLTDINSGRELHCQIIKSSFMIDSFVQNALMSMYASCGFIEKSVSVFDRILQPDLVSWSAMISGYVQNGQEEEGMSLFCEMGQAGILPDESAFSIVVGAAANLEYLGFGLQLHGFIVKMGYYTSSLFLQNSLMDFYATCGDVDSSRRVFDRMLEKDLISWNIIVAGYVQNLCNYEALMIFQALMVDIFECDEFTLASILQAVTGLGEFDEFMIAGLLKSCALQSDFETGKMLHTHVVKYELKSDPYITSSLIDMYAKCGITEAARWVFWGIRDPGTVPWSAIIAGHCRNGWFEEALWLFRTMQFDCIEANEFTYTSIILACIALGDLKRGKELHCHILRAGYGVAISVVNTLIKLYSSLGCIQQALKLCSLIPESEISWGALIQACASIEDYKMVLKLFHRIQQSSGQLDHNSAYIVLDSCANPVLLNAGVQAQAYLMKRGLVTDPNMSNSLIKMYSGSGKFAYANDAFNWMLDKNSASWTLVISANVDHGHPSEALNLFMQMCCKNKFPDSNTFSSVLKACAQLGLVNDAFWFFISMNKDYGIEPSAEHYSHMVDVLGRAGRFEDAKAFIKEDLPFKPDSHIWRTLLSSCRIQGNMRVAKYAAEKLLELEPSDCAANLLLEQILLTVGKWDDALKPKNRAKFMRPSYSWIEIRNHIHEFASNQILTEEVSATLEEMARKMRELGYVSDKNHWLHDAEEEHRGIGFQHTEIIAIAFGLVWLPQGTPIRISKSVRMCGDCHSVCKFMSTFIGRDMFVKDSCRFHHFRDGRCSCRDAW